MSDEYKDLVTLRNQRQALANLLLAIDRCNQSSVPIELHIPREGPLYIQLPYWVVFDSASHEFVTKSNPFVEVG
jgi:hypothetical protein